MVSSIEAGGSWTNVRRDQNLDDEHSKRATPSPPKLFPTREGATAPPCSSVGPPLSALILSHPGINSAVARYCPLWAPPLCPHGFVSGNSRATSQWVTHPGIALAPNSLNFEVPTTPKPVSSQKASY
ncbi:hypothetical protein L3X38_026305 [Prunus dulcis]|uniref:Uncharacterized protein n=1 Tax=Prunus dulcis TaxID=3755 RepID=A0AAD4YIU4_PRUDU|nr:hypothetical protein L3X38_026305 [Prunus dulcis]